MADAPYVITFGINNLLRTSPSVTAQVGTRVYPQRLPDTLTVYPAITYNGVSLVPQYTHQGPSGVRVARVQINSWHSDYSLAKRCAAQVEGALSGYRGYLATTDGLIGVGSIMLINEIDQQDPDTKLHMIVQDYKIEAQR